MQNILSYSRKMTMHLFYLWIGQTVKQRELRYLPIRQ
jgi:hypothetical protein